MGQQWWAPRPDHISPEDSWCGNCRQGFAERDVKMYAMGTFCGVQYVEILCGSCAEEMKDRYDGPVNRSPILVEHSH